MSVHKAVTSEDKVFRGPGVVFANVLNPRSEVSCKEEFEPTLVKHGATIGANATIICGVTLGAYSFIGAGAVMTKNVPARALMTGNPRGESVGCLNTVNGWTKHPTALPTAYRTEKPTQVWKKCQREHSIR